MLGDIPNIAAPVTNKRKTSDKEKKKGGKSGRGPGRPRRVDKERDAKLAEEGLLGEGGAFRTITQG